jgi:hypothetical protein
MHVTHKSR